ncbi:MULTISPECIES: hypothetical protein [Lactococcus]|uniref:hypothetical protein n=1 Tax=Lactococcus TaxID=1357 RepID=UPI000266C9FB|nr:MULTISPECIES: hypothetical protein [Lactococcus]MDN5630110.1 hypothetical protein [Lactococcus sp.]USI70178.1 hypothetical protein LMJ99_09425 [Lactococcus garvieae subsp. garvieae]EIT67250.1 Putative phage protein [Lactococcus garvieae IPLA 31405]MBS4463942.1 hypothetical protein [Lactococcus garvieae]MCH1723741.1 hypothetical protein [Lactococcus formosensis]
MTIIHKPKTAIGKKKFEIAEALNTITDLQNSHKNKALTAEQRYQLFNTSMRTVCNLLDIDLDMHELLKTGSEGFSYSDGKTDTEALQTLLDYKSNSTTCVHGREVQEKEENQKTVKTVIEDIQEMIIRPDQTTGNDFDVFADLLSEHIGTLRGQLGLNEKIDTAVFNQDKSIKSQLQDIYSLNDSMFTGDPYYIPRFTDGSEIKAKDLADMNMHALEAISELLGFELEEGATQLVQSQKDKPVTKMSDQSNYDSLTIEDKTHENMLNKLHEIQDYILNSGQNAVSMNQVKTATSMLEWSLGVMGKVEE